MFHAPRSLLILITVGLSSACGPILDEPSPSILPSLGGSSQEPRLDPELQARLLAQIKTYVYAVRTGDPSQLRSSASSELLERIAERGPAGDFEHKLEAFLARERFKLNRELGLPTGLDASAVLIDVALGSLRFEADSSSASALIRLNGHTITKPFYLVREGQTYRMNIVPPRAALTAATSNYRAQNDDPVIRGFSCSGGSEYSIGVRPSQRLIPCVDSCRAWWFDGTTFAAQGSITDCDYNTWGVDVYIRGGYPVCNDPC